MHYCVMVLTEPNGKSVEELLAPFDEELEVAPYVETTKAEYIKNAKSLVERYKSMDSTKDDEDYAQLYNAKTDEELYEAMRAYDKKFEVDEDPENFDEEGNKLSTYNPNSHWDWYEMGGRYCGKLKATIGSIGEPSLVMMSTNPKQAMAGYAEGKFDSALVKDIDFSPDPEIYNHSKRFWEFYVEGKPLLEFENPNDFWSVSLKEHYINHYGTKENYANTNAMFCTYAVVTPDGVWHERNTDDDENYTIWNTNYKKDFIDTAKPDWTVTIVDCHI